METKQTNKKAAKTKPLQTYFNLKIFSNIFTCSKHFLLRFTTNQKKIATLTTELRLNRRKLRQVKNYKHDP